MITGLLDLDATAVASLCETLTIDRREQDVDDLRLVLQWADLHSGEPAGGQAGGDRLVQLGGQGTPLVQELCWGELAIARLTSLTATRRTAAAALDLRHRLPIFWTAVEDLRVPVWVACKVAAMCRDLSLDAVGLVDVGVSAAVDQSPARLLKIAEAKIIEADVEAHRARLADDAAKLGVHVSRPRTGSSVDPVDGEPGSLRVTCKLPPGVALGFDAAVGEIADALDDRLTPAQRATVTRGDLEAQAVELLSNPHAATAFLDGTTEPTTLPRPKKRPAVLYLFLSDLVLSGSAPGVARVEGIGPMLLDQLAELLQHRDLTVQPVIDLDDSHSVNGYEHPTLVKTRTLLRMLGDVFPHSANTGYRRLDHDHPTPYVPPDRGGPPGQTGDHNDGPLTRTHHRMKTHLGYQCHQVGPGVYRWTTPHGLRRLVTATGTTTDAPTAPPRRAPGAAAE